MKKYFFIVTLLFLISCSQNQRASLPPESKDPALAGKRHSKNKDSHDNAQVETKNNSSPQPNPPPTNTPLALQANNPALTTDVNINTLTATVLGVQTSQLSFRVAGYISQVLVQNGQYVKKGQVIAKLDNRIALEQLNLAKFALEQANTAQHFAQLTLKRTETLNQRQATTQIALEQAQAGYQNALIAAKTAQSNLKLAQINFDENNLVAPFDGYLFNLSSYIGNYVSSTSIISTLTSINDLQIQIPVPQTIVNNFKIGQVFPFSNSSQNISGTLKITGIVPYVDANSKTYLLFGTPVKVHGQLMAGELVVLDLK